MTGDKGDPVVFIDRWGDEHEGIIQRKTMHDNADLMFFEENEFDRESIRYGINIPCEDESANDRRVYRVLDNPAESELADEMRRNLI